MSVILCILAFLVLVELIPTSSDLEVLEILNKEVKKYVVISSDLDKNKPYYYFYLPIITEAWRRVGFEPVFLIVSSDYKNLNNYASKSIEYLKKLNSTMIFLQSKAGYETITSMMIRLFIGIFPNELINDDDFVITSDADLIPISKTYYNFKYNRNLIKIWNGYCCLKNKISYNNKMYTMFPMSHIGMVKSKWRQVLDLNFQKHNLDTDSLFEKINEIFKGNNELIKKNDFIMVGDTTWFLDQTLISIRIHEHLNSFKNSKLILKRYEGIRLDRIYKINKFNSLIQSNFHELTDFHGFHNNDYKNWDYVKDLFEKMFDNDRKNFFFKYFEEFNN